MPEAAAPLNTYVTEHYGQPGVVESAYYVTAVTDVPLTPDDLACAVAARTPDPARRYWHHPLWFPAVSDDPRAALRQVWEAYERCGRCHLSNRRNRVVLFRGNPDSPVVLMGEGPGRTEDVQGLPFVGDSGRLQDKILESAGITPNSLGWMNLVGCRPCANRFAANRAPKLIELAACSERTLMLLRALRPSVVVCLGQVPTRMFWDEPPHPWTWHSLPGGLVVGHARHPSYMLRRLRVKGGEEERTKALRFYTTLRDRIPQLSKLPAWVQPMRYLEEVRGRVLVGT